VVKFEIDLSGLAVYNRLIVVYTSVAGIILEIAPGTGG
jgi:hypothetical protein